MNQLQRNISFCAIAAILAGCSTWGGGAGNTASSTAAPAASSKAEANKKTVIQEWTFADGDTQGWRMGWSSSEETAITDMDVEAPLGLKLTLNYEAKGWGDSNLKLAWTEPQAPVALSMRILIPAELGKPKGPLQVGCAMNEPWSEAKHWPDLKVTEHVTIGKKEYLAQNVTCRLGSSSAQHKALILRFGGERVRFKGNVYIQNIRALSSLD
jgi:hypothetical protein